MTTNAHPRPPTRLTHRNALSVSRPRGCTAPAQTPNSCSGGLIPASFIVFSVYYYSTPIPIPIPIPTSTPTPTTKLSFFSTNALYDRDEDNRHTI